MIRRLFRTGLCVFALLLLSFDSPRLMPAAFAQGQTTRNIQGKVLGGSDAPLTGAIVYLQNSKTNDIKTFITTADGSFLFGYTSTDTDYTIWAMYKGKKSETKTVTSFNTRKEIFLDLHVKSS